MKKNHLTGVLVCFVVIFVASFMPWGNLSSSLPLPFSPNLFGGSGNSLSHVTIPVNGWNGHLTLLGISIPNWIVIVVAGACLLIEWKKSTSDFDMTPNFNLACAGYGIFHSGLAIYIMITRASVGIGSLLTFGAFLALGYFALQELSGSSRDELENPVSEPESFN